MEKQLKVYYANLENMGDQLNKLIIEDYFKCKVVRHTYLTAEISGIGSGLGQFTLHGNNLMKISERIAGAFFPKVKIWGTGFYYYDGQDGVFYRKGITFCAVRGELSKKRVENILGQKMDIPTGDAGILASYLIHSPLKKIYEVGVIPHMNEIDDPMVEQIVNYYSGSKLIKVTDDPLEVVKQIGQCKVIVSSSLHGLIVADSFNIPNRHIVISDKLGGDGFKFEDYYSAYGLQHEYTDLRKNALPSIDEIREAYKITKDMVEDKKRILINCFPGSKK